MPGSRLSTSDGGRCSGSPFYEDECLGIKCMDSLRISVNERDEVVTLETHIVPVMPAKVVGSQ